MRSQGSGVLSGTGGGSREGAAVQQLRLLDNEQLQVLQMVRGGGQVGDEGITRPATTEAPA
jgi:hypothetical protein